MVSNGWQFFKYFIIYSEKLFANVREYKLGKNSVINKCDRNYCSFKRK